MQSYALQNDIAWPEQATHAGPTAPCPSRILPLSRRAFLTGTSALCLTAAVGGFGFSTVIRDGWVLRPEDI